MGDRAHVGGRAPGEAVHQGEAVHLWEALGGNASLQARRVRGHQEAVAVPRLRDKASHPGADIIPSVWRPGARDPDAGRAGSTGAPVPPRPVSTVTEILVSLACPHVPPIAASSSRGRPHVSVSKLLSLKGTRLLGEGPPGPADLSQSCGHSCTDAVAKYHPQVLSLSTIPRF